MEWIAPSRNNAQVQPITTVLRNIIREYPAGGGVLRELCQNADDAGATKVVFVLDETKYPTDALLHPDLAEWQGTSLLAYNNSTFSDTDFESLSRIGDSAKAEDLSSTGKFGRGFNSVYNWTDNPSILSGSSLLILDPHHVWSAQVGSPGGPLYDFVQLSDKPAMIGQLSAFSSILQNFDSPFDGTIIRIPLRTEEQARNSKIVADDKHTSPDEILDVFKKYADELVETLLFLRNVQSITLKIGDKIYASAEATAYDFNGTVPTVQKTGPSTKAAVNGSYRKLFLDLEGEICDHDFVMDIHLYHEEKDKDYKFAVSHHLRKHREDVELQVWARSQKLFPWVAIATPLKGDSGFRARLFSTLPLPISTQHPVHIHGMFSITPDRTGIHSSSDRTLSESSEMKMGSKWNEWLFQQCLVHAWANNIQLVNQLHEIQQCEYSGWKYWPAGVQGEWKELWMGILAPLFEKVARAGRKLLPTICDTAEAWSDILLTFDIKQELQRALIEARIPVVSPPEDRKNELCKYIPHRIPHEALVPKTLRKRLTSFRANLESISAESRKILLSYILSDKDYNDLGRCNAPLLTMKDGTFRDFVPGKPCILAMDDGEIELFHEAANISVDLSVLPSDLIDQLRRDIDNIKYYTSLSTWDIDRAVWYCNKYIFSDIAGGQGDIIRKPNCNESVEKFWNWLDRHRRRLEISYGNRVLELESTWLVPILNEHYRRTKKFSLSTLDISEMSQLKGFLRRKVSSGVELEQDFPLYTGSGFSATTAEILRKFGFIVDAEDPSQLIKWLAASGDFLSHFNDEDILTLIDNLNRLTGTITQNQQTSIKAELIKMSLFREVKSGTIRQRPLISLGNPHINYVGIKNIPVALHADNTIFIDISHFNTESLVRRFKLASCPSLTEVLESFVVPNIFAATKGNRARDATWVSLVEYVLENVDLLSQESKNSLSTAEIVPVAKEPAIYKSPREVFDPKTQAGNLFFPEEQREPIPEFFNRFRGSLGKLGMISEITQAFVLDRIRKYSKPGAEISLIARKVHLLLINYTQPVSFPPECLSMRWIPARRFGETRDTLFSPSECRDRSSSYFAKYALPIFNFEASQTWKKSLKWDLPLTKDQLFQQIRGAVNVNDTAALLSLVRGRFLDDCISELQEQDLRWIPDTSGRYFRISDIFISSDCAKFKPYLSTLHAEFSCCGNNLFRKLGVQNTPSFQKFKELQDKLDIGTNLQEDDLNVALSVLKEVGRHFADENYNRFKAPDIHGRMHVLSELTAGNGDNANTTLTILHPQVSPETIRQLKIPSVRDRFIQALDESDFEQTESRTKMIQDTLKRLDVKTTFDEYLANAEDCGEATKICWMVDASGDYPTKDLLSDDLADSQGPALFCYNDGEFTEKDFNAIVKIGVGSKQEDDSKIGKFGRGALTMYHWTSVPSFISGEYFVIFDPEQTRLPYSNGTRSKRAGMKLPLARVRENCPDQLRPFEGVFGFNSEMKSFPGTIFRFPLRNPGKYSPLTTELITIQKARNRLATYFLEAHMSLLFLKNISSISLWEKGQESPIQHISLERREEQGPSSRTKKILRTTINKEHRTMQTGNMAASNSEWLIIQEKMSPDSKLMDIKAKHRLEGRCGVAALISDHTEFQGRHFMDLPLQGVISKLPVHITADMVIESNRKSISIPVRSRDGDDEDDAAWNKWIFSNGLVDLYLSLLEYIMKIRGAEGYRYWPKRPAELDPVSATIATGFWQKVTTSSYKLFPPVSGHDFQVDCKKNLEELQKPETLANLNIKESIFDLLEPKYSQLFLEIHNKLGFNNIVSPTQSIKDALGECGLVSQFKVVSRSFIVELIHSKKFDTKLHELWTSSPDLFNKLLLFITEEISLETLRNCKILPLNNETLGSLSQRNQMRKLAFSSREGNFLVPKSVLEKKILEFFPEICVHPEVHPQVIERLISNGNLNVVHFSFDDTPELVDSKNISALTGAKRHGWLERFWDYHKEQETYDPEKTAACLDRMGEFELHSVTIGTMSANSDARYEFITPAQMNRYDIPVIVQPFKPLVALQNTLAALKGLKMVNRSTFSEKKLKEEALDKPLGMYRLLRAIRILSSKANLPIRDYIRNFPQDRLKVLQEVFASDRARKNWNRLFSGYPESQNYMQQIPLWKSARSNRHLATTEARLIPYDKLELSSVIEDDRFVDHVTARIYRESLQLIGITEIRIRDILDFYLQPREGASFQKNFTEYCRFLKSLFAIDPQVAHTYSLAVNGLQNYCKAGSLYDHSNTIFTAAFRGTENTHFLHPNLRYRDIFNPYLLKDITQVSYTACARSIESRLYAGDPQVLADANTVFGHLEWDHPDFQNWHDGSWNTISNIAFVPVKTNFSEYPGYARSRMQEVAGDGGLSNLSTCVRSEHVPISWSQKKVFNRNPGTYVTRKMYNEGAPSCETVLQHLYFLSDNRSTVDERELPKYIQDVKACYEFLQSWRMSGTRIPHSKIVWLNIEATQARYISKYEFQNAWTSAEKLYLGSGDDGERYKYVRSFLSPLTELLEICGVKKVVPPKAPPPGPPPADHAPYIVSRFREFRAANTLCDVTLEADGQRFEAHRVILCAASDVFYGMFRSGMSEMEGVVPLREITASTVNGILDYIYNGKMTPIDPSDDASESYEKLVLMLEASERFQLSGLKEQIERSLCSEKWIRPETAEDLLSRAIEARAHILSGVVRDYIARNSLFFSR